MSPSPPVLHAPADQQDCPVTLTLAKPTTLSFFCPRLQTGKTVQSLYTGKTTNTVHFCLYLQTNKTVQSLEKQTMLSFFSLSTPANQKHSSVTLTLANPTMLSILFSSCKTTRLSSHFNIDKFIDQQLFASTPVNLMVLSCVYNPRKFNSTVQPLQTLQNQQDCPASSNPAD